FSPVARLRILSEEPVSGATSILVASEADLEDEIEIVRYNERATAHVFDVELSGLDKERISNTTVPRIYESLWTSGGEGVILRYLDDDNQTIKTYHASLIEKEEELREGETPFSLEGSFLPDNISQIVLSPTGEEIFWLTESIRGARGVISNPDGTNQSSVFSSDFTEWIPQWFSQNLLSMTTKASAIAEGFYYTMPRSSGAL